ncbi:hypothetical protein FGU46_03755 [Methanobacterium sp. CWC-01]|uniref:hypothetical protein n=1 Tax=Methanobacterium aridiramus TaxID=2584467 RepID=UPI002576ADDC|nr:hypothetical protein [Methanobacterium sp. CWC-01]WJI09272.1 hypothetical protein FGU46_03755 [Methanobacterium sp. CWC-01]
MTEDNKNNNQNSKTVYTRNDYIRKALGLSVIVSFSLLSIWLGFSTASGGNVYWGLGTVGFGTFFAMLAGTFLITDNWELADGEFRKALTISIISVYFFSLAFANQIQAETVINATKTTATVVPSNIVGGLFNNLWAVVLLIIGFYFADKVVASKK